MMDANVLRGLFTILMMVIFAGIIYWAYGGRQRQRFEEAANLPFADDNVAEKFNGGTES